MAKNKEITIGLSTSSSRLLVSVYDGVKYKNLRKKIFNQENVLYPSIAKMLPENAGFKDIKTICAVRGPGRFTGIRIGLTVAGTFNVLSNTKIFTSDVFEILAYQAFDKGDFKKHFPSGGKIAVLINAFKEEYFCKYFKITNKSVYPESDGEAVWLAKDRMIEFLSAEKNKFYCIADEEEKKEIYNLIPCNCVRAAKSISKVLPEYIIKTSIAYGCRDIKPLYLKPAKYELDAIEKAKKLKTK